METQEVHNAMSDLSTSKSPVPIPSPQSTADQRRSQYVAASGKAPDVPSQSESSMMAPAVTPEPAVKECGDESRVEKSSIYCPIIVNFFGGCSISEVQFLKSR